MPRKTIQSLEDVIDTLTKANEILNESVECYKRRAKEAEEKLAAALTLLKVFIIES